MHGQVTTQDGYILSIQRIPNGRSGGKNDGAKIPVLLQHGLMSVDTLLYLTDSLFCPLILFLLMIETLIMNNEK